MKAGRLSIALGNVDGQYIEEAETYAMRAKQTINWRTAAIAACFCLFLAGAAFVGKYLLTPMGSGQPPIGPGAVANQPTDEPVPHTNIDLPDENAATAENYAVYVPAIELQEQVDENIEMDMIGLIVYKGRIYTQAQWYGYYQGDDVVTITALFGERLGFAKGNIHEWSTQDDYATEFAGSAYGDVYAVNGYSDDFRLAIRYDYENDDGSVEPAVCIFENLNGIGLNTGKDLFGDRIHMENWAAMQWQSHESWNYGKQEFHDLDVQRDDVEAFIQTLFETEFSYNENGIDVLLAQQTDPNLSVKDTEIIASKLSDNQVHINVRMTDGTVAELRLFEGGYVTYQPLHWSFYLKLPAEVFDVIYQACR